MTEPSKTEEFRRLLVHGEEPWSRLPRAVLALAASVPIVVFGGDYANVAIAPIGAAIGLLVGFFSRAYPSSKDH